MGPGTLPFNVFPRLPHTILNKIEIQTKLSVIEYVFPLHDVLSNVKMLFCVAVQKSSLNNRILFYCGATTVTWHSLYGPLLSYQLSNNILRSENNNRLICTHLLKVYYAFAYHYECYNSPEEYYKESIFVSSTNSLILNLETRFKQNNIVLLHIEILLPTFVLNQNSSKPMSLNILYEDRMYENAIRSEYLL